MYNHATNSTENKYFMKRLFTTFWFYSGSSILNEGGEIGKGKISEQIILLLTCLFCFFEGFGLLHVNLN